MKFCRGHSFKFYFMLILCKMNTGIGDSENIFIDKGCNRYGTRKKEPFQQYKLDTLVPYDFNERVVDLEWI